MKRGVTGGDDDDGDGGVLAFMLVSLALKMPGKMLEAFVKL